MAYPGSNYYRMSQGRPQQQQQYQNNGYGYAPPPVPPHPYGGGYGTAAPNMGPQAYYGGNTGGLQAPPSNPQHFDNRLGNQYNFQYSNCSGRRKALLIGINYYGTSNELRGCINDVHNMRQFLNQRYGYAEDDMVILTDDQANPRGIPTRANMIQAMHWLVKDAQPNDSLFFHYSGHGSRVRDQDGDEDDGYDETIIPVDYKSAGEIVDDELHWVLVKPLPPGCRLTAIFDCCHSGSALDLPYTYSTQGVLKEPNILKEAGSGLLSAGMGYMRGDLSGMISSATSIFNRISNNSSGARDRKIATKTSPADVISFSGCKDTQTSADTSMAGQATGAMSFAFRNALLKNAQQSYVGLLNSVRAELTAYSQKVGSLTKKC